MFYLHLRWVTQQPGSSRFREMGMARLSATQDKGHGRASFHSLQDPTNVTGLVFFVFSQFSLWFASGVSMQCYLYVLLLTLGLFFLSGQL